MTQNLTQFLTGAKNKNFAIKTGTATHTILQRVIIDTDYVVGEKDIVNAIKQHPNLLPFFSKTAQTEAPIAGIIHGHFISRRIDRMLINHDAKTIDFIDYKTDTNKNTFIEKYTKQLQEYAELLCSAYPNYKIKGYILWLQDWSLDKII